MSFGVLALIVTLVVVLVLSVLAIVVSTTKGARGVESWWRGDGEPEDETHRRHARHWREPDPDSDGP